MGVKIVSSQISVDEDHVSNLMSDLISAIKKCQLEVAKSTINLLVASIPGLKNSAMTLKNAIVSATEGLRDKATTKAVVIADLTEEYNLLQESLSKILDNLRNPAPTSFEEALQQDLDRTSLRVYDKDMNVVQTRLNKSGVFTGYVPVLPISGPPLDAAKLNRAGIPAERFAGYTILNKQFVAGISNDFVRANVQTVGKDGKKRESIREGDRQKILDEFVETVKARYKHLHMNLAADPHSWWDATWFWFLGSAEYRRMLSCTINDNTVQSLKVKKWSFPFVRK